jgi:hypothetical protein
LASAHERNAAQSVHTRTRSAKIRRIEAKPKDTPPMFTAETRCEIAAIANDLELEPEALLAIAEVESGGKGFAMVSGKPEPLIRFEGHYFDRRLSTTNRMRARAEALPRRPPARSPIQGRKPGAGRFSPEPARSTPRRPMKACPRASARSWARIGHG